MPSNNDGTAFYTTEEMSNPTSEYWRQRRRFADNIRLLQNRVQTTELSTQELELLNNALEQRMETIPDQPRLEGRKAWIESEKYGGMGVIHTEMTSVIGPSNPITPGMSIWFDENGAHAKVNFGWIYEGNSTLVHGGWIAAVFDEFLGTAQVLSGKTGMTGQLSVNYIKPTPLNTDLYLSAQLLSFDGRKINLSAEIGYEGTITATAEALFIVPTKEKQARYMNKTQR